MDITQEVKLTKGKSFFRIENLLVLIIILQMLSCSYTIVADGVRIMLNSARRQELREVQEEISSQKTQAYTIIKSYENTAYGNQGVDRISEQQLLATETTNALLFDLISSNNLLAEMLVR